MAIFNSYVSLPEGILRSFQSTNQLLSMSNQNIQTGSVWRPPKLWVHPAVVPRHLLPRLAKLPAYLGIPRDSIPPTLMTIMNHGSFHLRKMFRSTHIYYKFSVNVLCIYIYIVCIVIMQMNTTYIQFVYVNKCKLEFRSIFDQQCCSHCPTGPPTLAVARVVSKRSLGARSGGLQGSFEEMTP